MTPPLRRAALAALIVCVAAGSWLFRFNDPGGSFAGLTDDHFFYVVRGWQILYGDLPVRDFVDHGAPLYYYIAAAVQLLFGRGTLSEVAFSTTVLSIGAVLTVWLAARASGSLLFAAAAGLFHVWLEPRYYNYPKILVYAVAIPLLWRFADRPGAATRTAVAGWTVIAFLLRHDHGLFVAGAMGALLVMMNELPPKDRVRHVATYAATAALLAGPYLLFIQVNGGMAQYLRDASDWAAKDRHRAPVVWPGLFEQPGGILENLVAWLFYLELVLPVAGLVLVAVSQRAFRPDWPHARAKIATTCVLGIVLNAGFLRSPLEARLADPSVPHAIVFAWLLTAGWQLLRSREPLRPALLPGSLLVRGAGVLFVAAAAALVGAGMSTNIARRAAQASLTDGPGGALERSAHIARQLREEWRLGHWAQRGNRPDLMNLTLYLDACTRPSDRVFVQPYIPQVLALARRAFAGGHADLRPGFFTSRAAQELTLARIERQSVPVALLELDDEYANFRKAFPEIAAYLDREYVVAGTRIFDGRFGIQLLARKDLATTRRDPILGWPCFR